MIADEMFADELVEIFAEEIDEVLQQVNSKLAAWRLDVSDLPALKEIRRGFHTIKGSGRMVQAEQMAELAWAVENMLNHVLDKSIIATPAMFTLLDHVLVAMPVLLSAFKNKQASALAGVNVGLLIEQADALRQGHVVEALQSVEAKTSFDANMSSFEEGSLSAIEANTLYTSLQDTNAQLQRLSREYKELQAQFEILQLRQAEVSKEAVFAFVEQRLELYSHEVKELKYFVRVNGEKLTSRLQDTQQRLTEKVDIELNQVRSQRQNEQQQQQIALQELAVQLGKKAKLWAFGSAITFSLLTYAAVTYV